MTKDERFLVEIYKALEAGEEVVDPANIAGRLGYKEIATREILKGLRQANLVKLYSPTELTLTDRGREVAHSLVS